jgi:hypothetical protein
MEQQYDHKKHTKIYASIRMLNAPILSNSMQPTLFCETDNHKDVHN